MGRTEDVIRAKLKAAVEQMAKHYEKAIQGDDLFWEELDKMDAAITKRLARRPLDNMEVGMVTKKAVAKFKAMCGRMEER